MVSLRAIFALELDDRAAGDLPLTQVETGLIDLLQLVAARNEEVERQLALFVPPDEHREVAVRDRAAAGRAPIDLAAEDHVHGRRRGLAVGDADYDGDTALPFAGAPSPRR